LIPSCRKQGGGGERGVKIKESPIFVKTYDFTKWLLEHTIKFPKNQRFVMAKRIEDAILNFHDLLILAVNGKAWGQA
jgi:hypothetical protein